MMQGSVQVTHDDPRWTKAGRASEAPLPPLLLVVDDDPESCLTTATILRAAGYRVEWSTRPSTALGMVATRAYRLVLSDVNMPEMLGTELAGEIARMDPDLPVLLMSGFVSPALTTFARAHDLVLLAKPLQRDVLCAVVQALLLRSRPKLGRPAA